jgi:glycosyltransferase involved in cell wall biosynthesis
MSEETAYEKKMREILEWEAKAHSPKVYKVMFCATYPNQTTGYSKIANIISNVLAHQTNVKLYYFGFSNFESTRVTRMAHENIEFIDVYKLESERNPELRQENFGTTVIAEKMLEIQPDMLFIYNDLIVTCRLFNALQTYKAEHPEHKYTTVVYIDLVYKFEKQQYLEYLKREADMVFVFSECWKKHLLQDFGWNKRKIKVFRHGFGLKMFQQIDRAHAREQLRLSAEDFIVCNINRNTYRKMWDICIESFLMFLKQQECNPRIKLFINCALKSSSGFDIIELIGIYCKQLELDKETVMNKHLLMLPEAGKLSDHGVNLIHCASDVGLNTCSGEGFGLCSLEGACLGIPQIVSKVGALADIFEDLPSMTIQPVVKIQATGLLDDHLGEMEIIRAVDVANQLSLMYNNPEQTKILGALAQHKLKVKYNWDNILDDFACNFETLRIAK